MNKLTLLVVTLSLPAAALAAPFEGKVDFALTSGRGQPQRMTYQLKGDKLRMELPTPQGKGTMLVDPAKKEMLMLMDEQRMYMVMAMPDVQAQAAEAASGDAQLEKTGQKEKIAGYEAEKYIVTHEGMKTELWLAEGLGTFMFGGGNPMMGGRGGRGAGPAMQGWERALAGKELFPLRVISRGKDGKETFKLEATSVQKQSLPDSLFTVPADYQKFDMGMMRGMMPGVGR